MEAFPRSPSPRAHQTWIRSHDAFWTTSASLRTRHQSTAAWRSSFRSTSFRGPDRDRLSAVHPPRLARYARPAARLHRVERLDQEHDVARREVKCVRGQMDGNVARGGSGNQRELARALRDPRISLTTTELKMPSVSWRGPGSTDEDLHCSRDYRPGSQWSAGLR